MLPAEIGPPSFAPATAPAPAPAMLTRLVRMLSLASLEALSVALCGWVIRSRERMPGYARSNDLTSELRRWVFINMAAALLVAFTVIGLIFL
jgi:hypothetical protein